MHDMATRISPETAARVAAAWPDILERIAAGESVGSAAEAHNLTRHELYAYRAGTPELVGAWYDAMKESADAFTDGMVAVITGEVRDAKAARVKLTGLQWLAEKRDPERYGQRSQVNLNVKTVDLTRIISDANARLIAAQQRREIDVTPNNSDAERPRTHALQPEIAAALAELW